MYYTTPDVLVNNDYYPFGLKHKGYNNVITGRDHKYGFGGKEYNDELRLDWYDVSARNYDPTLGRWMNLDPLAEQMRRHSPYNYAFDNPVFFIDYDGMKPSGPGDDLKKKAAKIEGKIIDGIESFGNGLVSLGKSFVNFFSQKSATNYTTKDGSGSSPPKLDTVKKENMDTVPEADKLVAVLGAGGSTGKTSKVSTKSSANPNTDANKFGKGKGDATQTTEFNVMNVANFVIDNFSENSSTMNAETTAGEEVKDTTYNVPTTNGVVTNGTFSHSKTKTISVTTKTTEVDSTNAHHKKLIKVQHDGI